MEKEKSRYIESKLRTLKEKINEGAHNNFLLKYIDEIIDLCKMEHLK